MNFNLLLYKITCVKQVYLWDVEKEDTGNDIPQVWGTPMTFILIFLSWRHATLIRGH